MPAANSGASRRRTRCGGGAAVHCPLAVEIRCQHGVQLGAFDRLPGARRGKLHDLRFASPPHICPRCRARPRVMAPHGQRSNERGRPLPAPWVLRMPASLRARALLSFIAREYRTDRCFMSREKCKNTPRNPSRLVACASAGPEDRSKWPGALDRGGEGRQRHCCQVAGRFRRQERRKSSTLAANEVIYPPCFSRIARSLKSGGERGIRSIVRTAIPLEKNART